MPSDRGHAVEPMVISCRMGDGVRCKMVNQVLSSVDSSNLKGSLQSIMNLYALYSECNNSCIVTILGKYLFQR